MIKPVMNRLLIEVEKTERKTKGGIYLTDEYATKKDMAQLKARVLELGESAFDGFNIRPNKGDLVLISKFAGLTYEYEGYEFRIVDDDDITAIIEEETNE